MFYPSGVLFFRNSSGGFCYHFGLLNVLDPLPVFGRLWIVFGRQMGERELIWLPPVPIARTTLFSDAYEAKGLDLADSWADCVPADAVSQKSRNVTGNRNTLRTPSNGCQMLVTYFSRKHELI